MAVNNKVCSRCKINKDSINFNKDRTKKYGLSSFCRECLPIYRREYRQKNIDKIKGIDRRRYLIEKSKRNAGCKIYYIKNSKKIKDCVKSWVDNNKDRVKENKKKYYKENYNKLKPTYAAAASKRRAAKKARIPVWADLRAIEAIYIQCGRMNHKAGYVKYHVDHEIPMINNKVCGLHTIENLRIIPAFDNWSKNNKYEVL